VVEAALRSLFPPAIGTAVLRIGAADGLWPGEAAAVAGAVPQRRAEFAAGRSAARLALAQLGLPPVALPMGADRAPLWPGGICGAISHAAGLALAVVARDRAVGVDLEPDAPIAPDLWDSLCAPGELQRLPLEGRGQAVTRVFVAKEAVFKAQRPEARAMFGFDAVEIALAGDSFDAHLLQDAGAFRAGQRLRGGVLTVGGVVLAGVTA